MPKKSAEPVGYRLCLLYEGKQVNIVTTDGNLKGVMESVGTEIVTFRHWVGGGYRHFRPSYVLSVEAF